MFDLFKPKPDLDAAWRKASARVAERRAAGDTRGMHDAQQSASTACHAALAKAVRR